MIKARRRLRRRSDDRRKRGSPLRQVLDNRSRILLSAFRVAELCCVPKGDGVHEDDCRPRGTEACANSVCEHVSPVLPDSL